MVQVFEVMSQLHRFEGGANQMGQNTVETPRLNCLMPAVSNNVIELQNEHKASAEQKRLFIDPAQFQGPKYLSTRSDALSNCFSPG